MRVSDYDNRGQHSPKKQKGELRSGRVREVISDPNLVRPTAMMEAEAGERREARRSASESSVERRETVDTASVRVQESASVTSVDEALAVVV